MNKLKSTCACFKLAKKKNNCSHEIFFVKQHRTADRT